MDGVLYELAQDGKTVFLSNRPIGEDGELYWSPDSHFLAAWLQLDISGDYYSKPKNLLLIDVEKPLLTDLCLQNQPNYFL